MQPNSLVLVEADSDKSVMVSSSLNDLVPAFNVYNNYNDMLKEPLLRLGITDSNEKLYTLELHQEQLRTVWPDNPTYFVSGYEQASRYTEQFRNTQLKHIAQTRNDEEGFSAFVESYALPVINAIENTYTTEKQDLEGCVDNYMHALKELSDYVKQANDARVYDQYLDTLRIMKENVHELDNISYNLALIGAVNKHVRNFESSVQLINPYT